MVKQFSQACANNQVYILQHLQRLLNAESSVLEIGSGTGQHAVYFAEHLPQAIWQTSDLTINHNSINAWIDDYSSDNCLRPVELDVTKESWLASKVDAIFSANTMHIMAWPVVEKFIANVNHYVKEGGLLIIYGPFNYEGRYTSDGNANFDQYLRASNPQQGIRDIEQVVALANKNNLYLKEDNEMPANNRLLVFEYKK